MMPCWHFSISPPAAWSSLRMMFSTSSPTLTEAGYVGEDDGERNRKQLGERLSKKRLARAGRPNEQDVGLCQLDVVPAARLLLDLDPLVVVVDRDGQLLLGSLLADDVLVQELLDFLRRRQRRSRTAVLETVIVRDDVVADLDALIADKHCGSGDELSDIVLIFIAERTPQDFRFARLFHHALSL